MSFDLAAFIDEKVAWSRATFGPAQGVAGVIAHIRKEIVEAKKAMEAADEAAVREEFADICLLAIDLWWRGRKESDGGVFAFEAGRHDPVPPLAPLPSVRSLWLARIADVLEELEAGHELSSYAAWRIWALACRLITGERAGGYAEIAGKFAKLKQRTWPDWRTIAPDQPIEHVRDAREAVVHVTVNAPDPQEVASAIGRKIGGLLDGALGEWKADSIQLRAERQRVREVLGARPNETVEMAARRAMEGKP